MADQKLSNRVKFNISTDLWWTGREGHGNPLQSSCVENPMDRGTWRATVHGVAKSQTQLKQLGMHRGETKGADMISVQGDDTVQMVEGMVSFLHSSTLTSIHDHWKNHSLD